MFKHLLNLFLILSMFQGCSLLENKNPLNEYEEKIRNYYMENLNDPKSYESIKTDIISQPNETIVIKHSYRAKNAYNAMIKTTSYFIFKTSSITEVDNLTYKTFNDLLSDAVTGFNNYDNFFLSLGVNKQGLSYRINKDKNAIREFCDIVSKTTYYNMELKSILEKEYGIRYLYLYSLIYNMPNEMSVILMDSY